MKMQHKREPEAGYQCWAVDLVAYLKKKEVVVMTLEPCLQL
jgi:hypothetical protein